MPKSTDPAFIGLVIIWRILERPAGQVPCPYEKETESLVRQRV